MSSIEHYKQDFLSHLQKTITKTDPKNLYEPMHYILNLGGKRLRPVLTLMGADLFNTDYRKALHAALAIEVFHNFSLVHDDIMDKAPLRRGQKTVHNKWNINTAILSGDAMLILAYQLFENYEPTVFQQLAKLFSQTALEVCEGQQLDMDFESRNDVTVEQYLLMIQYKTAVLVGAALQMGAIVAQTSAENKQLIYDFGVRLGMAFQLQDDYLDTFGDSSFGKQIGGDILENKKTMLYLKALQTANSQQINELLTLYASNEQNPEKVQRVKQIFTETKAGDFVQNEIEKYTQEALQILEKLNIDNTKRTEIKQFALDLMHRNI
ncbi:polyprenyl synthetase family protein [Capnocytophaga sp.]|uniref:polyprenyl synthetase family protein n=1 Tax=Capnocytophaga sp. TaxID=44737 RepID=UPI0026DCF37A|nr:polyprenyl synthetase family protein [Capnocytophaga sp.]MDO5104899.1 polyprenyl synthetase family protein [Capnocytophaga sp.]